MPKYSMTEKNSGVDLADRKRRLGEVYAFLIDLARQKRPTAQATLADFAKNGH